MNNQGKELVLAFGEPQRKHSNEKNCGDWELE